MNNSLQTINHEMTNLILHRKILELFPDGKNCTILQIGANDGYSYDPLYKLITESHCEAFLLEPIDYLFQSLQALHCGNQRVRCINAAISDCDGKKQMNIVKPEVAQKWQHGIGSFIQNFHTISGTNTCHMTQKEVITFTFTSLIKHLNLSKIDVLVTDCEGYDLQLIRMFPFETHPPKIIQIEFDSRLVYKPHECGEMIEILTSHGYHHFRTNQDDLIAWK